MLMKKASMDDDAHSANDAWRMMMCRHMTICGK